MSSFLAAQQITALYDKCNAAAIAAAKLNASTVKYETLFPCTKNLTSTQFGPEGLDTCRRGVARFHRAMTPLKLAA